MIGGHATPSLPARERSRAATRGVCRKDMDASVGASAAGRNVAEGKPWGIDLRAKPHKKKNSRAQSNRKNVFGVLGLG